MLTFTSPQKGFPGKCGLESVGGMCHQGPLWFQNLSDISKAGNTSAPVSFITAIYPDNSGTYCQLMPMLTRKEMLGPATPEEARNLLLFLAPLHPRAIETMRSFLSRIWQFGNK